jgi:hypothetical protein
LPSSQTRTELTEIGTALGMLCADAETATVECPPELRQVSSTAWERVRASATEPPFEASFASAFSNGRAFLLAEDGLRGRRPRMVEWKGPHKIPGDDVIPADLRIDHVYLVSCKYVSQVLFNASPARLFDRLLVGDQRAQSGWFEDIAPAEYRALYDTACAVTELRGLVPLADATTAQRKQLSDALKVGAKDERFREAWKLFCTAVAHESANRWSIAADTLQSRLRLLWRMLRITSASYFVLGSDRSTHLRLRVGSAWDWVQEFDLRDFQVAPRPAGQPIVDWHAFVHDKKHDDDRTISGHVEIRWSHGRFVSAPEAKIYLDTSHGDVAGYYSLG